MEFNELIENRFSCKNYNDKKVEKEALQAILEAGRLAPTAKNRQEQRIYVVQSEEGLKKIDEITPCRYGASTVLVCAYKDVDIYRYGKNNAGIEDVAIVSTYMMLASKNAGVDSCWINRFDPEAAKKVLGLPEDEEVVLLMDLGYPSELGKPLPNHFSRKDLAETVEYK